MGNNATAELEELFRLQKELINLSKEIDKVCEFLKSDLSNLNYSWDDRKFVEFEESIMPKRVRIKMLSEKYCIWADTVLQKHIDNLIDLNSSDMGTIY